MSKRSTVVLVALSVVAVVAVVGVWLILPRDDEPEAPDFSANKAEIEALGFTFDPGELGRKLYVPPKENAAIVYMNLGSFFDESSELETIFSSDTEETIARTVAYHKNNPHIFEELRKATSLAGCDFGRNWTESVEMRLPELRNIRNMAKYCRNLAVADADAGEFDGAYLKLLVASRLGWHLSQDPLILSMDVAGSCQYYALSGICYVLLNHAEEPRAREMIEKVVRSLRPIADIDTALQGDLITGWIAIDRYTPRDMAGDAKAHVSKEERKAGKALFLENFIEVRKILHASNAPGVTNQRLSDLESDFKRDDRFGSSYTTVLGPNVRYWFAKPEALSAVIPIALQALEVLEAVDEIGLESAIAQYDSVFDDEFNGTKLVVASSQDGFKLYSTGRDGIDDGGPINEFGRVNNSSNDDFGYWIILDED